MSDASEGGKIEVGIQGAVAREQKSGAEIRKENREIRIKDQGNRK